MNLNEWYHYGLGGDYNTNYYQMDLSIKIINSQEDRIAYNRSLVQLRFSGYRKASSGAWNGYDNTSFYEFDYGNRSNTTTRYDWRNATAWQRYFINDGNSVLYKGSEYTFYVYHNADGSRQLPIRGYFYGGNTGFNYADGTFVITLPTIPRASQPSLSGNPTTIGNNLTIYTNRVSTSFTHTLRLVFGSFNKTLATGVGDNYVWNTGTDANSIYQQIPNAPSGVGTIYCDTYSGGSLIGTKEVGLTLSVPASSKPTFPGFSFSDINAITSALTGNNQLLIMGYSNLRVLAQTATAQNYATMASYKAQIGTKIVSSANTTIDFGTTAVSDKLIVSAVDSRGLETPIEATPTIIPYSKITIASITTLRQNGVDPTVVMVVNGVMSKIMVGAINKNSIKTTKYRTKLTSSGTWGSWNTFTGSITIDGNGNYTINRILSETFNTDSSYNVEFYIEDQLDNNTIISTVIKSIPLISFRDEQIGINKIPEAGNTLDVGGLGNFDGNITYVPSSISSTNLNNITKSGIYKGTSLTNAPVDNYTDWWYIHHIQHSSDFATQIAYPLSGTKIIETVQVRNKRGGAWGTWISQRQNNSLTLAISSSPYSMSFPASWTAYTIPFNIDYGATVGARLTRQGSGVRIGAGVKVVEISGTFSWYNTNTAVDTVLSIYKNGAWQAGLNYDNSNDLYCTVSSVPLRLNVVEGDVITLVVSRGSTGNVNLFGNLCRLNVEAVE